MSATIVEPFYVDETNRAVWYIATDIENAREQYEHFVEDHTYDTISEGEDQWETVCEEGELQDQEYPLIIAFRINLHYADRHECITAPLGNAIRATPPELVAHYQLTQ